MIYVNDPAEKKIKATKLARLFCRLPEKQWKCKCKYCKHYEIEYPFDNKRAADWFKRNGRPDTISVSDLRGETELAKCFPMFSEPKDTKLRKDITIWREGHNHLILESLFDKINRRRPGDGLRRLVTEEVNKYAEHTSLAFGNFAKVALSIALK